MFWKLSLSVLDLNNIDMVLIELFTSPHLRYKIKNQMKIRISILKAINTFIEVVRFSDVHTHEGHQL